MVRSNLLIFNNYESYGYIGPKVEKLEVIA